MKVGDSHMRRMISLPGPPPQNCQTAHVGRPYLTQVASSMMLSRCPRGVDWPLTQDYPQEDRRRAMYHRRALVVARQLRRCS